MNRISIITNSFGIRSISKSLLQQSTLQCNQINQHFLRTQGKLFAWYKRTYQRKYTNNQEHFFLQPQNISTSASKDPILSSVTCFSNVCQKMIPVLDNYFHRLFEIEMEMEISALYDTFNNVLTRCCSLYRFHPMPITYLYQSLYYFPRLR